MIAPRIFAAGFHLSSVAIIWPKSGHELTRDMLSMKERWFRPKVIGSKSCLSAWTFAQSRARASGPNVSHKRGEECIPCPFTANDIGALVVLDPWPH
jgi:hypothetical protein